MRLRVAQLLERGDLDLALLGPIERLVGAAMARRLARPVRVPPGLHVVTVGGATLGGSGKTPLAIACARALAEAHIPVALVGHAYGARPGYARVVRGEDPLDEVGDEALIAHAALARAFDTPPRARHPEARAASGGSPLADVVVAPTRDGALALAAARGARVAVLDGPVQLTPRADLALLAVDADAPWGDARAGHGACPPAGDLRAPRAALTAACDRVVGVDDALSRGARAADGSLVSFAALARLRLGLFTALARPGRLVASLGRRGVAPTERIHVGDHARSLRADGSLPTPRTRGHLNAKRSASGARPPLDAWLATEKCALHYRRFAASGGFGASEAPPLLVLEHGFVAPPHLARLLIARFGAARGLDRAMAQQ